LAAPISISTQPSDTAPRARARDQGPTALTPPVPPRPRTILPCPSSTVLSLWARPFWSAGQSSCAVGRTRLGRARRASWSKVYIPCQYKVVPQAGVAKLGQRRKIQGLILSGSGVQIPSPALPFLSFDSMIYHTVVLRELVLTLSCVCAMQAIDLWKKKASSKHLF
jgi:hypothetical protein